MKRKILTSYLITIIFTLLIITSAFVALINLKEISSLKEVLNSYNKVVIETNIQDLETLNKFKINNKVIRFTFIDSKGNILLDTENDNLENHINREEINEALKNGKGTSLRYSKTEGKNVIYFANKINEEKIIRSSIPLDTIKVFTSSYTRYYILLILSVIIISIGISLKLIKAIVYPIKELENASKIISKGDYSRRVTIYTKDEIGSLGRNFNDMAEQLECKIRDSIDKKNKLESILESMESGIIAIDTNENVILINQYAKSFFEINEDIIGKNIYDYVLDYDFINFIRDELKVESREIKILHPFDRDLKIKRAPIINDKNIPIGTVFTIQDITDIKRLENMRSQFVANVTHELKTPLTSIKGFSETLRYVEDVNTKTKFLDIIDKETDRLTNLINDILILSNIENNQKMKEERFNQGEVISEVINIVYPQMEKKNITIEVKNKGSNNLIGDKDKFYQMILNLVENSIKYSENDKKITISVYDIKDYLFIEVEDQGVGIPNEDLSRVFERFYMVDKSRAKRGTGLGLAIVKHIVKMFNGEIYVKSELGCGTKFTIKIRKRQM
ncbi:ATP-binding protein [Clostridium sp.]|uniref:ATP-binding protein n=1 Tax=Clostridium sp. TaxID=1506 RepID=UPI002636503E|nr:ATP-binding protein [Clostridium sp.]